MQLSTLLNESKKIPLILDCFIQSHTDPVFIMLLHIADRKKDLLKLQTGEYIAIGQVETTLKMCTLIEQICVHGSSYHDYTIAFVIPSVKPFKDLAASMKIEGDMAELCKNDDLKKEMLKKMTEYGIKGKTIISLLQNLEKEGL